MLVIVSYTLFNTTNKELSNVSNWLVENKIKKLFLNEAKTKYVVFRTPHSPEPLIGFALPIKNNLIAWAASVKFLG